MNYIYRFNNLFKTNFDDIRMEKKMTRLITAFSTFQHNRLSEGDQTLTFQESYS